MNTVIALGCAIPILLSIGARYSALAQDANSGGVPPFLATNLVSLLQQVETTNPDDIRRDAAGRVVALTLRQGFANESNLFLVSTLHSLQRLSMLTSRRAQPSESSISSLIDLTNLNTITFNCGGQLPGGVFRATCSLKGLQNLGLDGAYPPAAEYAAVTNLQELVGLRVTYCTNFSDQQLSFLTNLPKLKSIELWADSLSASAPNYFATLKKVTNFITRPHY